MSKTTAGVALILSLPTGAAPALAHIGEHAGDAAAIAWHVVLEPVHLPLAVAAVFAVVLGGRALRRAAARLTRRDDRRR